MNVKKYEENVEEKEERKKEGMWRSTKKKCWERAKKKEDNVEKKEERKTVKKYEGRMLRKA